MMTVLIWSALTIAFMWRFRVIMINASGMIRPGQGWLRMPSVSLRPVVQLAKWAIELWFVAFFYQVFGLSIAAHLTAAICGAALTFMMRERKAPLLEGLQFVPINWDNDAVPQAGPGGTPAPEAA